MKMTFSGIMAGEFLRKVQKNLFFALQIEKTEINILQKGMGKKVLLLFKKNYF